MQHTITVTAVLVLVLLGIAIKGVLLPSTTVAGTHDLNDTMQSAISVYDMHVTHPGMKAMPVQAPPLP